jgi:hypothetical protein
LAISPFPLRLKKWRQRRFGTALAERSANDPQPGPLCRNRDIHPKKGVRNETGRSFCECDRRGDRGGARRGQVHPLFRRPPAVARSSRHPQFGSRGVRLRQPRAFSGPSPSFAANPTPAKHVGTPGWARALAADGSVVADFSVGPGPTDVKIDSISATPGFPLKVLTIALTLPAENASWEKTEFGHVYLTGSENPYRKVSVRG